MKNKLFFTTYLYSIEKPQPINKSGLRFIMEKFYCKIEAINMILTYFYWLSLAFFKIILYLLSLSNKIFILVQSPLFCSKHT